MTVEFRKVCKKFPGHDGPCELIDDPEQVKAQALEDIAYLDDAARRLGTRLDIPAELPGLDEDHAHFVLMPIGAAARRAAVTWLRAKEGR